MWEIGVASKSLLVAAIICVLGLLYPSVSCAHGARASITTSCASSDGRTGRRQMPIALSYGDTVPDREQAMDRELAMKQAPS